MRQLKITKSALGLLLLVFVVTIGSNAQLIVAQKTKPDELVTSDIRMNIPATMLKLSDVVVDYSSQTTVIEFRLGLASDFAGVMANNRLFKQDYQVGVSLDDDHQSEFAIQAITFNALTGFRLSFTVDNVDLTAEQLNKIRSSSQGDYIYFQVLITDDQDELIQVFETIGLKK